MLEEERFAGKEGVLPRQEPAKAPLSAKRGAWPSTTRLDKRFSRLQTTPTNSLNIPIIAIMHRRHRRQPIPRICVRDDVCYAVNTSFIQPPDDPPRAHLLR